MKLTGKDHKGNDVTVETDNPAMIETMKRLGYREGGRADKADKTNTTACDDGTCEDQLREKAAEVGLKPHHAAGKAKIANDIEAVKAQKAELRKRMKALGLKPNNFMSIEDMESAIAKAEG